MMLPARPFCDSTCTKPCPCAAARGVSQSSRLVSIELRDLGACAVMASLQLSLEPLLIPDLNQLQSVTGTPTVATVFGKQCLFGGDQDCASFKRMRLRAKSPAVCTPALSTFACKDSWPRQRTAMFHARALQRKWPWPHHHATNQCASPACQRRSNCGKRCRRAAVQTQRVEHSLSNVRQRPALLR